MNEQSYFHWDLFRPQLHSPSFAMGASFLDIREEAVKGISSKTKSFSLEQPCALWSKDLGLQNASGRVQEYRKEKSRDAARSRRGKENYEFYELAKLLPLPAAITSQLDKASIIRLSINYLKLRDFCGHGDPPWIRESLANNKNLKGGLRRNTPALVPELFDVHLGAHILQSLDGFAFVLSNDGRFLYISETVSIYLGLSQVEMAGSSIFDYVHGNDHQELADQLGLTLASLTTVSPAPSPQTKDSPASSIATSPPISDRSSIMSPKIDKTLVRSFCIRMKSTLTKRGVHTRSSGYRVVQIIGQFRTQLSYSFGGKSFGPLLGLTGVAMALPPRTITELRIENDTFIMRLTAQFKIIYCENIISILTDWRCDDVSGKDLYTLCHPGDVQQLNKLHRDLLMKGQVMSSSFRFLNKLGGYIWVQLCCTSIYSSRTSEDQIVLAIFQTLSNIEHRCVAMDTCQLQHPDCPILATDEQEDIDLLMHENMLRESLRSDHISDIASETHDVAPIRDTPEVKHIRHTQEVVKRDHSETSTNFLSVKGNDCVLDETELSKPVIQDGRLSRRKTDHPRKRRRQSRESACVIDSVERSSNSCVSDKDSTASIDSSDTTILNILSEPCSVDNGVGNNNVDMTTQHTPQDLSLKTIDNKILQSIKCVCKETNDLPKHKKVVSNSVHELEIAMSKHLPTSRTKPCSLNGTDIGSLSTLQQTMLNWTGSCLNNMPALTVGHLYTNRESVIRSSLSRRAYFSRNDSAVASMATPATSDIFINNDQLSLQIPHISVSNQYTNQKRIAPLNSCYGITPPSPVSPHNKMESPFPDDDIMREYLEMQTNGKFLTSNYTGKYHCVNNEKINELSKSTFLHAPSYQYHAQDLGNSNNLSMQSTVTHCESRPSSDSTLWYGSTFPS